MALTKATFSVIAGAPANVLDFGAVGDGVADDTAAFNAVIAWANAKGGSDRDNIKGSTIFIPEGRYKITAPLNPITVSSVCFLGVSQASAVIVSSVVGAMFRFGDATLANLVVGGGIQNLSIEYPVDPTGVGTCVVALDYAFSTYFRNIGLNRAPTFLRLGETSTRVAGGVQVDNLSGSIANSGYPAFNVRHGAGLNVSNSGLFVRGVPAPVNPNPMTTVAGTIVFSCSTGSWDTIQVSNCIFERFDQGLAVTAGASTVIQNIFFANTIFDYCRRHAVYLEANGVSAAIVTVQFNDTCWLNSWEEDSVALIRVDGVVDNVLISGSSAISGKRAVYYDVSNASANKIVNFTVNGANRLGTVQGAIVVAANSTGFTLSNIQGNNDTSVWTRPDYGVVILADCDRYTITNCALYGPIGGYSFAANASGSKNRLTYGNVNAGYAATAITAVPATNVTYTNTSGLIEEWIFSGGTITGGYSKNGVGISGALASLTMTINPGDAFSIGYSVAPTAVKSVMP
jgi:hypothetical protein